MRLLLDVRASARRTLIAGLLLAVPTSILYIPPAWVADLGPPPDALEYAVAAKSIARGGPYVISLLGGHYPPRYPFGFPALIAPAYWLPHAVPANGIYAVTVFGVLASVAVYRLGALLAGRVAGLVAALTLLVLPQYVTWNQQIMSEGATAALTAASALLLYHITRGDGPRQRILLALLGLDCGLALLVHITNVALPLALLPGVLVSPAVRRTLLRSILLVVTGPFAALAALGIYDWATFGNPTRTGYEYWVPQWYGSLGREFSLSYALKAPGIAGDASAPLHSPNGEYYLRALAGLLPHSSLLPGWAAVLALAGVVALARRRDPGTWAFLAFAGTFTILIVCIFSVYFFQTTRFLAPLAPLAAVLVGAGARAGLDTLQSGIRDRRLGRLLVGALLVAATAVGVAGAARATVANSYVYRAYVAHDPIPVQSNSWTAALYRRYVRPGSIIITDVLLPFLDDSGVSRIARVVPLTRGEYWNKPPLRNHRRFAQIYRELGRAIRRGIPVFTDAATYNAAFVDRASDPVSWRELSSYRLVPVGARGPAAIYRLRARS